MKRFTRKAQGATEYALFIAAVLAALLALQIYFSRAIRGQVKEKADSIAGQLNTEDGAYVREIRSASSRSSVRGYDAENENTWSTSDVVDDGTIGAVADGMLASHLDYDGGEYQEQEYINEFDTGSYDDSTAGVARHGAIVSEDENVFEDAALE